MNHVINAKNFVVKHKIAILVYALIFTTSTTVAMRHGLAQHNAFLKEHDLYEEFYALAE